MYAVYIHHAVNNYHFSYNIKLCSARGRAGYCNDVPIYVYTLHGYILYE